MSLTLKLPRQQRRTWFRRPRGLEQRQWIERLPTDRPEAVLRLVNRRLRDLNFTALPARHRVRCLAPFHRPLLEIHERLTERLDGYSMPLPRNRAAAMRQLAAAWARLSVGYLCSIRDAGKRETGSLEDAALGALRALGRLLLARTQVYASPPAGTWRIVHECHAVATEAGTAQKPSGDSGDARDAVTAYKQILVLGGTDMYRLRPAEQLALYQALAHWVRLVSIKRLRSREPKGPPLVFRPGEDESPRIYPHERMPDAPGLRLIDTATLAGHARQRLKRLEEGDTRSRPSGARLSGETLRNLLGAWSGSASRRFPRSKGQRGATIALGLTSSWRLLANGRGSDHQGCRLTARSASGFQAMIDNPAPDSVQVGEVVVVTEDDARVFGVVRWLRQDNEATLHLGVEALSREAGATTVALDGESSIPVFLLEANRATDQPPTLITPRSPLRERMAVTTPEGHKLTLERLLEGTASYCRFRYRQPPEAE